MQFPESWLREYVNVPLSTDELAHQLTMAGLEVEEVESVAPAFSGVVVARIESVEPHPNADKLRVCSVNCGSEWLQIVCGAPNAVPGLMVPLAKVGAVLPGDMKIGVAKMRGVESAGMLCSARELGLSQDHAGLMVLDDNLELGQDIREALELDESVLTLKLTPNRADCLSILGVAREVAALNDVALQDKAPVVCDAPLSETVAVKIEAPDLCGRFAGRIVRGVNARAVTPKWMVQRLERAGQRSVSALVDISNYLMLERGRPTHVFDLDKMAGRELTVRWACQGEVLELLNGETIELHEKLGIICAGSKIESLAGIMGGHETAVSLETSNVYLEAAFWWPEAIAGRTRELKINSEAAHRFERGVDFATIKEDLERLTNLVLDICGGQAAQIDEQSINLPERKPVSMRLARCCKVLGIELSGDQVASVFDRLSFNWRAEDGTYWVTPPSYRFDIAIEEDLIEEVARMIGFDNIPAHPPLTRAKMHVQPETHRGAHALRDVMVSREYQEVINFSFVERAWEDERLGNANPITLLNPIASQMSVMRSSLMPSLLANVVYNANRKQSRVRVFEIGRIFASDTSVQAGDMHVKGVSQPLRLAAAAWGSAVAEQWGIKSRTVDFFDVKRDLEVLFGQKLKELAFVAQHHPLFHPGRCAAVILAGVPCGYIGEIHPKWVKAEGLASAPVMFEVDLQALIEEPLPISHMLSKQPMVQRDLALWVNANIPVQALLDTMRHQMQEDPTLSIIQDLQLFDVWRAPQEAGAEVSSEVSLAFRIWLQDPHVTLEDERVDQCVASLRDALIKKHGARPR
jgi:phenylalanyl-tRNA synthetase beta chain